MGIGSVTAKRKRCEDCGGSMKPLQARCKCGWVDSSIVIGSADSHDNGLCAHLGCTDIGAHSKSGVVSGRTRWYCFAHAHSQPSAANVMRAAADLVPDDLSE